MFISFVFVFSAACSRNNELCTCIEKGKALDKYTTEVLRTGNVSKQQENRIELLRKEMHKTCDVFQFMPTKELQEKKQECASLQFEAN
jgi:hypothetical protein